MSNREAVPTSPVRPAVEVLTFAFGANRGINERSLGGDLDGPSQRGQN